MGEDREAMEEVMESMVDQFEPTERI
jgi:hypothetical protein